MSYTPRRRYFRGHNLVTMQDVQAGTSSVYHFDHQGTTQCLTDTATGAVTDRFASDAWGVQVKRTGASINRQWYIGSFGYYGTPSSQVLSCDQRYYTSGTARWASRDLQRSGELDRAFAYVDNSRGWLIDPAGLQTRSACSTRSTTSCVRQRDSVAFSFRSSDSDLARRVYPYNRNNPTRASRQSLRAPTAGPRTRPGLPSCNGPRPWIPGTGVVPRSDPAFSCYERACQRWSRERDLISELEFTMCGGADSGPWAIMTCKYWNSGLPQIGPNEPSCPECFRSGGDPRNWWSDVMSACCVECQMRVCCWIVTPRERVNDLRMDFELRQCYDLYH